MCWMASLDETRSASATCQVIVVDGDDNLEAVYASGPMVE